MACGKQQISEIREDDWVLARTEINLDGPVEPKRVLATFRAWAPILELHLADGKVIRSTHEHPFWKRHCTWTAVKNLQPGDEIALRRGWIKVEKVVDRGESAWVYNVCVEGYHTYFVGREEWDVSVWAHNASNLNADQKRAIATEFQEWRDANPKASSREFFSQVKHPTDGTPLGSRQIRDIKDIANNDKNWTRPGQQRGPQPRSAPAVDQRQNYKVAEVTERLENMGHEIRAGGRVIDPVDGKPVKLFKERSLSETTRKPDITAYGPVGPDGPVPVGTTGPGIVVKEYHYNIGPNKSPRFGGGPTKVEQQALDVMRKKHTVFYEGYGQRNRY